ncbi:MAG: ATP-binding protein [Pyrinomonadaceae bacterium]|nr:ATP-binding protein [Pyrinomonadaceae bacterium]
MFGEKNSENEKLNSISTALIEDSENGFDLLDDEIELAGGEWEEPEDAQDSIGRVMYDTPAAKDNTVTVLLPSDKISEVPSQSLVRIKCKSPEDGGDGRCYLGAVVQGPFAEPDGLRADAPIVITTTVRGTQFTPRYHGRVQVEILGEEIDGSLVPPRFRPLPNSYVKPLSSAETEEKLKLAGEVRLGLAVGYENMPVNIPSSRKDVFPRHLAVLGTTGGGKSTTVSGLIGKLTESGVATVLFDTEGEYTRMMEQTDDVTMLKELARRGLTPKGVENVTLYHLVGRETSNPAAPRRKQFSLSFSNLSPYAVKEILGLTDAQEERFLKGYELTRNAVMQLRIFPSNDEEKAQLLELDEMEEGFPRMTLQHLYDIIRICADTVAKEPTQTFLKSKEFFANREAVEKIVHTATLPPNFFSWRKVQGSLARLLRLKIFDNDTAPAPDYDRMTKPGNVTIIDLSDTDSPQVNNLVISEILRGLLLKQNDNYDARLEGEPIKNRVAVVIEEAHEFLSAERVRQMPVLFQQVARIARRGRKRWLGLIFVTQLPQHLPNEVLGLVNNFILHKISDSGVIDRLKRTVGMIDDGLWNRLPNLAPGQAIVSASSLARPLLVSIDPTPCKLRMVD